MLFAELSFPAWDPVAFRLGPLAVRWYGLGYLAGFLVAGFVLDKLGRDGFVALTKESVSDLIGWLVVGVLLGGRLGYALFYEQSLLLDPLDLVRVWGGGLSFHGGLLGVIIASFLFARRRKVPWRRLADSLSLAVPFGIFFVRCANFVNAELYGRIAPAALPWGVRFPTDPVARSLAPELAMGGSLNWYEPFQRLVATGRWQEIAARVPLRHPSQLYEAALEGLVMAAVLWTLYIAARRRGATLRDGTVAALFLLIYGLARFVVEFTREPDAQLGLVLGPFSMGQMLSFGVLAGAALIYWWKRPAAG
ncbi:MAG TPA: prolipoprotein diacylglyceryl transferase [Gemmatimonadales bacterium]|nr:prolipoprotein diacylglyceryl transferase [Gemmatimonadales bacterium]